MATKVEICNLALGHIGVGKSISNLDTENSREAIVCRNFFNVILDMVLEDFPWSFATKFVALELVSKSGDDDHPTREWQFAYQQPTNALKVRRLSIGSRSTSAPIPFRKIDSEQGTLILTDQANATAEITNRQTDPSRFPAQFAIALSFKLGEYVAPQLTGGDPFKMADRCMKNYELEKSKAEASSLNENTPDLPPDADLILGRS